MEDNTAQTPTTPVTPVTPVVPAPPVQTKPINIPRPIEPKKSFPKAIIILIVILLLVAVVGAGAYFLAQNAAKEAQTNSQSAAKLVPTAIPTPTPTPDPTADWKSLTSNACSLYLKYPNDWSGTVTDGNGCFFKIENPSVKAQLFTLNTLASPPATWSGILNSNKNGQPTTIGQAEGIIVKTDVTGGSLNGIYFHKNDLIYGITYILVATDSASQVIYDNIISSIKFTK